MVTLVEGQGLSHIVGGRVGMGAVEYDGLDVGVLQGFLQRLCQAHLADAAVRDQQHGGKAELLQQGCHLRDVRKQLGLTIGKQGNEQVKHLLINAAICLSDGIHGCRPPFSGPCAPGRTVWGWPLMRSKLWMSCSSTW